MQSSDHRTRTGGPAAGLRAGPLVPSDGEGLRAPAAAAQRLCTDEGKTVLIVDLNFKH